MPKKKGQVETVYKVPMHPVVEGKRSCIKSLIEKGELTKEGLLGCISLEPDMFHELEVHGRRFKEVM